MFRSTRHVQWNSSAGFQDNDNVHTLRHYYLLFLWKRVRSEHTSQISHRRVEFWKKHVSSTSLRVQAGNIPDPQTPASPFLPANHTKTSSHSLFSPYLPVYLFTCLLTYTLSSITNE